MSEHVWKIGDWCEWLNQRHLVWKVCVLDGHVSVRRVHLVGIAGSTAYTTAEDEWLKHLPNCDSWEWKPAPKYRPFANAAEFAPHRDRWVSREGNVGRACGYDEANCYFVGPIGSVYSSVYSGTWSRCFANIVFDDTKKPFGVEVTELEPNPATPS